jgi:hypothetical protein
MEALLLKTRHTQKNVEVFDDKEEMASCDFTSSHLIIISV